MSTVHFSLLCHTEGSTEDFEIGLPAMLELLGYFLYRKKLFIRL
jgi:hypothetical protein